MFSRSLASSRVGLRAAQSLQNGRQCLRRWPNPALHDISQRRSVTTFREMGDRFKVLYRANPATLPLAIVSLAISMGFIGYVSYGYFFVYKPIDHNYPKAVAAKLKRGIYHTSLEPDLHKALKYYQQALVAAEEEKMNPFSDEVIGIKLRIAKVLEENQRLSASIKALEMLRADIHRYLGIYGDRDDLKQHRTRLLRKVVQVSVKLGQLYASEAVDDLDEAEKNLTEGVETALTEARRRETEKVSDDVEGPWLSNEEMGGALEELGHHFDRREQYNLSSPLFLRALTLGPPPCHAAMLMNNLSTSIAQTVPDPALGTPTSKSALLSNATAWAEKALAVASEVKSDERTEECDQCRAVATYNLGEFAEMEGLWEKARGHYTRASSLAKAVGYTDGRQRADQALQRINQGRG